MRTLQTEFGQSLAQDCQNENRKAMRNARCNAAQTATHMENTDICFIE
jgi:hypothetical protein